MPGRFLQPGVTSLARWGVLSLGLLVLATGCSRRKEVEFTEVSGKVLYKGSPLPGGRVTFITPDGFAAGGNIDEKGNYKCNAPIGDVKVGVDNRMLEPPSGRKGRMTAPKKPTLKRPGQDETPEAMKGRYVPIPEKYYSPDESGLRHKVVKGSSDPYEIRLE